MCGMPGSLGKTGAGELYGGEIALVAGTVAVGSGPSAVLMRCNKEGVDPWRSACSG